MQPQTYPNKKGGGSRSGKRGTTPPATSRRRRSRSRSPHSRAGGSRGGRASGGGSGQYGSKKRPWNNGDEHGSPKPAGKKKFKAGKGKKPAKIGEYLSPSCFADAWSSFFSTTAIIMVTAVGLVTSCIPKLDSLPLAGRLKYCIDSWRIVCSNSWVCNVVEYGYKIPLKYPPMQRNIPTNPRVVGPAHEILISEAIELKKKAAVSVVSHTKGEYISSYFAVPKPRSPGKFRPILNLKYFNACVKKYKFTMETLKAVRDWIRPGAWCVGLDLKDAFPHIPMHLESRKYLRFHWLGELLQWDALPFGLTCSPRVITKVLKPVMAFLRATWAIMITIYIDDMLIQARSPSEALLHAQLVMLTMMVLGWSFNWKKSELVPRQRITHLGFEIDTQAMILICPLDKVARLQGKCKVALHDACVSVHDLERLLGTMESVRPSTVLAALHYRSLQRQLLKTKRISRRPRQIILLSQKSLLELQWWVTPSGFAGNCSTTIREPAATVDIWTDATMEMGGAHNSRGEFVQRCWDNQELSSDLHINLLELRAARESLLPLTVPGDKVRLHLDNTTACAYIRRQGGTRSSMLSREACLLWEEALDRDITLLSPQWLSTKENTSADFLSRNLLSQWEFKLTEELFQLILDSFQLKPTLDAFASQITTQLPRYMSWYPDRQAVARDALLHQWDQITYLFPPVPLLMKVLQKILQEGIRAILVCPHWPTALWWPVLMNMLVEPLLPLPHYRQAVYVVEGGPVQPYLDPLVAVHLLGRNMS